MHLRFDGASDVRSGLCKVPCHGEEVEHRARDGLLGWGHNCWSALLHHIKGEVHLEVKAEAEITSGIVISVALFLRLGLRIDCSCQVQMPIIKKSMYNFQFASS